MESYTKVKKTFYSHFECYIFLVCLFGNKRNLACLKICFLSLIVSCCKPALQVDPLPLTEDISKNTFAVISYYDGNSIYGGGSIDYGNTIALLNLEKKVIEWSYQGKSTLRPEIYKGFIFFIDGLKLNAIDLYTGKLVWSKLILSGNGSTYTQLLINEGVIYLCTPGNSSEGNRFYAINAMTGDINWGVIDYLLNPTEQKYRYILSDSYQLFDKQNNVVYSYIKFTDLPGQLYAINLKTGKTNWGNYVKGEFPVLQPNTGSVITVSDSFYVYNGSTGKLGTAVKYRYVNPHSSSVYSPIQKTDYPQTIAINENPITTLIDKGFTIKHVLNLEELNNIVSKDLIKISSVEIARINLTNITPVWSIKPPIPYIISSYQLDKSTVYISQDEGNINAVNVNDGKTLWKSVEKTGVSTNLISANNVLYGLTSKSNSGLINTLTSFDINTGKSDPVYTFSANMSPRKIIIVDEKEKAFGPGWR